MYSYGPPHMAEQKQNDQLEPTYSSSLRIRDIALRTCQKRWTLGTSGERGSGISVLAAWHADDDDDDESMSYVQSKALCIIIKFLVLSSICLSFSIVHFMNGPEYLTRDTFQVSIATEPNFEQLYRLFEELFFLFFFNFCLFDSVCFQCCQGLVIFFFS